MNDSNNNSSNNNNQEIKKGLAWELIFDTKKGGSDNMLLENLINKNIKVWSAFNDTIGGVRGMMKGTVGILTSIDDEFIVLDHDKYLSRKFVFRIEPV